MKITKKMRKRINGMNAATEIAFDQGYQPKIIDKQGKVIQMGVPYVNRHHFY